MSNSPKRKFKTTENMGRPMLYGEKTETFSIAVPKSKKQEVKTFVENLLKTYRVESVKK